MQACSMRLLGHYQQPIQLQIDTSGVESANKASTMPGGPKLSFTAPAGFSGLLVTDIDPSYYAGSDTVEHASTATVATGQKVQLVPTKPCAPIQQYEASLPISVDQNPRMRAF